MGKGGGAVLIVHHDDFDGVASAAVLAGFYSHQSVKEFRFVPVQHDLREVWLKPELPYRRKSTEKMAILDFPYHPTADIWFDHHDTTFHSQEYHDHYLARTDLSCWESDAPSCASLIYHRLWRLQPSLDRYAELAAAADMIDQARYPSPEAYFKAEDPAIAINHGYPELTDGQKTELAGWLMRGTLHQARANMEPVIRVALARNDEALAQVLPRVELQGPVAVMDLADTGLPFLRYAPYMAFPQAKYALTLYKRGEGLAISLGKNPWLTFPHVDLGAIARREGGGGHSYAASVPFPNHVYGNPYPVARLNLIALVREVARLEAKKAA